MGWPCDLLLAVFLTCNYVAGQAVQHSEGHTLAKTSEVTLVSKVSPLSAHINLLPNEAGHLPPTPVHAPKIANVKEFALSHARNLYDGVNNLADGEVGTSATLSIDDLGSMEWTVTNKDPPAGMATVHDPLFTEPVMIAWREDGDDFVVSILNFGKGFATAEHVLKRTPQMSEQLTVTVLEQQHELYTLNPPIALDAAMETIYTTVPVHYGQRITSIQSESMPTASSTEIIGTTTVMKFVTVDPDTPSPALEDVLTVTNTILVSVPENTSAAATQKLSEYSSSVKHLFTDFLPGLWQRGNGYEILVWCISLLLFVYLTILTCWLCCFGVHKPAKTSQIQVPGPKTKPRQSWAGLNTIPESAREGNDQDNANTRGTVSRRAEEGRGRAGLPGGQVGGEGASAAERSGRPATVVEEVKITEPGHPATVVQDLRVPIALGQLDGVDDSYTGSRVADTGSLRGRKTAHL